MKKVLVICQHNSCRSQIAEGLINHFLSEEWQAFSAGSEPSAVNPLAKLALEELGIDVSSLRSKSIAEFIDRDDLDLVITVCDEARQACPMFSGEARLVHLGFPDPEAWADLPDETRIANFRELREEIRARLFEFLSREIEANQE